MVLKDHNGRSLEKEGDCHFEDYRLGRNDIKNLVYRLLSEYTGMVLPWGTLTGIRPTKLPMEMYESGASRADAIHYLKDTYLVSDEKASLCAIVAENEAKVLKDVDYDHSVCMWGFLSVLQFVPTALFHRIRYLSGKSRWITIWMHCVKKLKRRPL